MKNYFIIAGMLFMSLTNAQTLNDAITYTDSEIEGSARFRALSGAFGALGGDPSAIGLNPASSSIFNTSFFSISGNYDAVNNNSTLLNKVSTSSTSSISLPQAGVALVFKNSNTDSPWRKFSMGLTYDRTKNHDEDWIVKGVNTNSIDSYFLNQADGLNVNNISIDRQNNETINDAYAYIGSEFGYQHQQAFLGYESFILEPTEVNGIYTSNIGSGTFNQEYKYITSGFNSKFTFNLSTQYKDNLYFGANINFNSILYNKSKTLVEDNDNAPQSINSVTLRNTLRTEGSGMSVQVGAIAKIYKGLRIGLIYDSPTWYEVEEQTTDYIQTSSKDGIPLDNGQILEEVLINPEVDNIYPAYTLQTPYKLTGSLAYTFKKKGLLSIDYSFKDYSTTKFKPTSDSYFNELNQNIADTFTTASTIKVGGEYRATKNFSLRGGYSIEQSPYKRAGKLGDNNGFSLGLGYSFKNNSKLDVAFNKNSIHINRQLYDVGLTDTVFSRHKTSNVTITYGIHL